MKRADFGGVVIDHVRFIGTVSDTWFRGKHRIEGIVPPSGGVFVSEGRRKREGS